MIDFRNFTKNEIDEEWLKGKAGRIIEMVNQKKPDLNLSVKEMELSLAIVGKQRIKRLNKIYRGKNKITDVLAFEEKSAIGFLDEKFIYPPDNTKRLGEVVICYPKAKKQAKEMNHSLDLEMTILLIHGILHLLGYDHEKGESDEKEMKSLEKEILGVVRDS